MTPRPDPTLFDAAPPAAVSAARGTRLIDRAIEATPVIAVILIAALIAVLMAIVDRDEREEVRLGVIRDALWVEQALRFQIQAGREVVERTAFEIAGGLDDAAAASRFRTFLAAHSEATEIVWRRPDGTARVAVPPSAADVPLTGAAEAAVEFARSVGRPVFGAVRPPIADGAKIDLVAPVWRGTATEGAIVVVYQLDRLLQQHVPWWIAQNELVSLIDKDGTELAQRSTVHGGSPALRHTISFDPPFPGVGLSLVPLKAGSNFTYDLLVSVICGLALLAAASIFARSRQLKRRMAAEARLTEAHAFRKAMEESLTVGMRARDLDGTISYVNPAFCRLVGYSAEELIGHRPPMPYWVPDLIDETLARHDALATGAAAPIQEFETRFRHRDGRIFDVMVYEAPLVDAEGEHRGWMGSIIDVTDAKQRAERERLEAEKLVRTARLITMGEMASTIAHELNQPLAAIATYAAGCSNLLADPKADRGLIGEALAKLEHEARRAGRILKRVHDFVRKREPRFSTVDLAALVQDVATFVDPDARKSRTELVVHIDAGLPAVAGDRILLEQVLHNLIRNGIEAMAGSGAGPGARMLEITLRPVPGERGPADDVNSEPAGGIALEVADRGPGIAPDLKPRLFEPFLTTKTEGMGMGLNICRSIVELHRGRLSLDDRPGGGTLAVIYLPAAEGGQA
ncbi:nitrogen regulation protein NR(II) [Methyloraptor flagellatus]|uniref:histidine kinase n=1 Tax=Methyloraptor flagellatus TaxID=3162530 RepID=A0AAU7XE58_9HYPH